VGDAGGVEPVRIVASSQPRQQFTLVRDSFMVSEIVRFASLRGVALDGFRPDHWDVIGAAVCLIGVALIMYAPRGA
jgi:small multidrug resistance family-3 protein